MFNNDLKKKALNRLKSTNERYQTVTKGVAIRAENLHSFRYNSSKKLIQDTEYYVNILSNSPKEFEKTVNELKISFQRFDAVLKKVEEKDNTAIVGGTTAVAGVASGVG